MSQDYQPARGALKRWNIYFCSTCGGAVAAWGKKMSPADAADVVAFFPPLMEADLDESIPEKPREFLRQAIGSRNAPAGAIMLAASSVDAMLKAKGLVDGVLNSRINQASEQHLITPDMAAWAHQIRLDANDQRHADVNGGLPTSVEAEQTVEFAKALAQFMFVLPARVTRGIAATASGKKP